jgi:catechol 2,3-dioxygenase-like lactoylglutathione lyase family enzyme
LYFDDLDAARRFYRDTLGLPVHDESLGITSSSTEAVPLFAWKGKVSNPTHLRTRLWSASSPPILRQRSRASDPIVSSNREEMRPVNLPGPCYTTRRGITSCS